MLQQLYTYLILCLKTYRFTKYEELLTSYNRLECARLKTTRVLLLQHCIAVPDRSIILSSISETNLVEQMSWRAVPCATSF